MWPHVCKCAGHRRWVFFLLFIGALLLLHLFWIFFAQQFPHSSSQQTIWCSYIILILASCSLFRNIFEFPQNPTSRVDRLSHDILQVKKDPWSPVAGSRSNCIKIRFEKIRPDRKRLMICANARLGVGSWYRKIRHEHKKNLSVAGLGWHRMTFKCLYGCGLGRNILSTHVVSQCCKGSCHILQSAPCSRLSAWRGNASSSSHLVVKFKCQTCRCSVASSLVAWKNYLAK